MLLYSVAMGKHAITALQWSCIAMCHKSPPTSSLLTSQAVFLTATASSTKLWGKATKILSSLWNRGESVVKETTATLLDKPLPLLLFCFFCACSQNTAGAIHYTSNYGRTRRYVSICSPCLITFILSYRLLCWRITSLQYWVVKLNLQHKLWSALWKNHTFHALVELWICRIIVECCSVVSLTSHSLL